MRRWLSFFLALLATSAVANVPRETAADRLVSVTRNDSLTLAGQLDNRPDSLAINNAAAEIYSDLSFAVHAGLPIVNGSNNFQAVVVQGAQVMTNSFGKLLPQLASFAYDANGNLLGDGLRRFEYDCANQLTAVTVSNSYRSEFAYDGFGRRRARREYSWANGAWQPIEEVRYIYDRMLAVQERHYRPIASPFGPQQTVTYTRGLDLSGSRQGAGGIGGLLARTELDGANAQASTSFYFSDAGGNVISMWDSGGNRVADYSYDPFGNPIREAGAMATQNTMRFSSKEFHSPSGLYYYGFRYYDPNLQRWLNTDPIGEAGGINLYRFVGNDPISNVDPLGLFMNVENPTVKPEGPGASDIFDPEVARQLTPGEIIAPFISYAGLAGAATGIGALVDAYGGSILGWLGLGGAALQSPPVQKGLQEAQRLGPILQQACIKGKGYLDRAIDTGNRLTALVNRATGETAFGRHHKDAYKLMEKSTKQIEMIHAEYEPGKGWQIYSEVAPQVEEVLINHLNRFTQ